MANLINSTPPIVLVDTEVPNNVNSAPLDLISFVQNKFEAAIYGKESTLTLQKETLQSIVDEMELLSDKLDDLKAPVNWTISPPLDFGIDDLVGVVFTKNTDNTAEPFVVDKRVTRLIATSEAMADKNILPDGPLVRFAVNPNVPDSYELMTSPPLNIPPGSSSFNDFIFWEDKYYYNYDGTNLTEVVSVSVPSSKIQLDNWENYISNREALTLTNKYLFDAKILNLKNIDGNISANFNVVKIDSLTLPYFYSLNVISPDDFLTQPKDTVFYLNNDFGTPKKYYFSNGINPPVLIAQKVSPVILKPTENDFHSWRTQLAEKQIQLTQRTTEFQAFLNATVAELNTFSDLFTNVLKTIFTSLRDIASRL